jgi:hypothetical protein
MEANILPDAFCMAWLAMHWGQVGYDLYTTFEGTEIWLKSYPPISCTFCLSCSLPLTRYTQMLVSRSQIKTHAPSVQLSSVKHTVRQPVSRRFWYPSIYRRSAETPPLRSFRTRMMERILFSPDAPDLRSFPEKLVAVRVCRGRFLFQM